MKGQYCLSIYLYRFYTFKTKDSNDKHFGACTWFIKSEKKFFLLTQ